LSFGPTSLGRAFGLDHLVLPLFFSPLFSFDGVVDARQGSFRRLGREVVCILVVRR